MNTSDGTGQVEAMIATLHQISKIDDLSDIRVSTKSIARLTRTLHDSTSLMLKPKDYSDVLCLRNRLINCLNFISHENTLDTASPLSTLDTLDTSSLDEIFLLPKDEMFIKILSLLSTFPILTETGMELKNLILKNCGILENCELSNSWIQLVLFSRSWMFCSYGTDPERHTIKRTLNQLVTKWLLKNGICVEVTNRRNVERPRLVVICEVLHSSHVQYRYFSRYLRQLKNSFEVIIVAPSNRICEKSREIADQVVTFDVADTSDIALIVERIRKQEPDIVFWPSVGMSVWGPIVANIRFAPIQICGLGHSASTFIDSMDYFLMEQGYFSHKALFSESLILLPDDALLFDEANRVRKMEPPKKLPQLPVRIAVPCNALKLNPAFLDTLARIASQAGQRTEFVFFPNCRAIYARALEQKIASALQEFVVHSRLDPQAYVSELVKCDLALSSFPFGGMHSTVDCLELGIPVVCLEGKEPHERTDGPFIRRLKLPEWLIASCEQDYIEAAVQLISKTELRDETGTSIRRALSTNPFFGGGLEKYHSAFADALLGIYRLDQDGAIHPNKTWTLTDLVDATGSSTEAAKRP